MTKKKTITLNPIGQDYPFYQKQLHQRMVDCTMQDRESRNIPIGQGHSKSGSYGKTRPLPREGLPGKVGEKVLM